MKQRLNRSATVKLSKAQQHVVDRRELKSMHEKNKNGKPRRCFEGKISEAELRDIITREARLLEMDFTEAVKRAKKGTLPRTPIGDDLSLLVQLLPA